MLIKDIVKIIEKNIPQKETWYRCANEPYGLYNADPERDINKALFCVTATDEVIDYAKKNEYPLIIQHHPFIKDYPMIIAHTAFDCCKNGLNDIWASYLGVKNPKPFDENLGAYGEIKPISFKKLCKKIKELSGEELEDTYCDKDLKKISSVVICTGLSSMVNYEASKTEAQCYVAGELYKHENNFKSYVAMGHSNSERIGILFLKEIFKNTNLKINIAPQKYDYFNIKER